jgi:hypothetical protein
MAIRDKIFQFCDDYSVSSIATSVTAVTDIARIGKGKDHLGSSDTLDIGEGGDLWFNVLVQTALTASSSATFTARLYHHTAASIASGSILLTATTAKLSSTSATSSADAGDYLIRTKVPAGTINEYLGCCVVASADKMAGGTIAAWISSGADSTIAQKSP